MKMRIAFQLLLAITADPASWAQRIREAKPGDIATGVIISEKDQLLRIDISPCSRTEDKIIVIFEPPYKKVPIGKLSCGEEIYDKVQVIQDAYQQPNTREMGFKGFLYR